MTNLIALPNGTELAGEYRIEKILGAGGFGVTYLAHEIALTRLVAIKEYFPSDFAARTNGVEATPRSQNCSSDYQWGLERFIEEAQTLAKFDHPNIVRVYRTFRANNTAYMVLQFEEGASLKSWLRDLGRAPRQKELDRFISPLLDALDVIHKANFLHRDIAPDNIIIRASGDPVLIDFGAARGDIAAHSKTKTVSALVKPGYSPYEQYAETSRQQGPWTDIYALSATLYHAVTGKRPPDSPSRMLKDDMVSARDAALSSYRSTFVDAIQNGLQLGIEARPQSVAIWRGALLAPEPKSPGILARMREKTELKREVAKTRRAHIEPAAGVALPPPDAPGPAGGLLDFVERLKTPLQDAAPNPVAAIPKGTDRSAAAVTIAGAKIAGARPQAATRKASPSASTVKAADAKAVPPPLAKVSAGRRKLRHTPDVPRSRPLLRGAFIRAGLAASVAALLFAFKDELPKVLSPQASTITTGAITHRSVPEEDQTIRQQADFKAHDGVITGLALSGDGRLIVTTGSDRVLRTWDAATRQARVSIPLDGGEATSLAVRNNRAVTAHADGSTAVYDLDTGRRIYHFKRNDAGIWAATFAGSEDRVAAAGHDWTVALWETGSEQAPQALLEGHQNAVQALAADAQGQWLASGGADRTVRLWNLETREPRRTYRNNPDFVSVLSFSPDSSLIAAGNLDGSIKLWSTMSGRAQRILNNHRSKVTSLAFSPDGNVLASAADDGSVRIRGIKHTRLYASLSNIGNGAKTVMFSRDGQTLFTGGEDGTVRLWSLPEARLAQSN